MATRVAQVKATDQRVAAMSRMAEARDVALAQSNRFLLGGMASSLVYAVKLLGLRLDLVVFGTQIFEIPYGLFAFCLFGTGCFIVAQLRFLDGQALDKRLKESTVWSDESDLNYYDTFPSKHQWLTPSYLEYGNEDATNSGKLVFATLGIGCLVFYALPLIAAAHFLLNWPELAGDEHTTIQWWLVIVFLCSAIAVYSFAQYLYSTGRK